MFIQQKFDVIPKWEMSEQRTNEQQAFCYGDTLLRKCCESLQLPYLTFRKLYEGSNFDGMLLILFQTRVCSYDV